jgi:hypothetical protein
MHLKHEDIFDEEYLSLHLYTTVAHISWFTWDSPIAMLAALVYLLIVPLIFL